jgi:hypothetical protein
MISGRGFLIFSRIGSAKIRRRQNVGGQRKPLSRGKKRGRETVPKKIWIEHEEGSFLHWIYEKRARTRLWCNMMNCVVNRDGKIPKKKTPRLGGRADA